MFIPELQFLETPRAGSRRPVAREVLVKENGETMAEFFEGKNPSVKDIRALGGYWSQVDEVYVFPDHSGGRFVGEKLDIHFEVSFTE